MSKPTRAKATSTLDIPDDVQALLETYAAHLSEQFGFKVTPQQAFERFARIMLGQQTGKGAADGHAD